jgi:hypothetical protein
MIYVVDKSFGNLGGSETGTLDVWLDMGPLGKYWAVQNLTRRGYYDGYYEWLKGMVEFLSVSD